MGIFDKGREYMENRNEGKREDLFREQMQELLQHKKITLKIYRDTLKATADKQNSGWRKMIPGVKSSDEWIELMSQVRNLVTLWSKTKSFLQGQFFL